MWLNLWLTLCCLWSVFWGWRYFRQMQDWKQRAQWAEHQLDKIKKE
jgi:hypothetical protein